MNRVEINAEEVPLPVWSSMVHDYILKVLDRLGRDGWDLSVLFCNNRYIRSLNERFRNINEPTDVLSFTLGTTYHDETSGELRFLPGDIIVSLETLAENAGYFHVSREEELRRLLIHGILHLDGMDHQTNEGAEPMLKLQEDILTELSSEAIF
ncbi:MAG: rRNA maturation RNase YbeY [Treponema sp.]|jgi:probable rRNA maturation factor|nr:rRNA maturation RNase YbeY [Treponema sp.]